MGVVNEVKGSPFSKMNKVFESHNDYKSTWRTDKPTYAFCEVETETIENFSVGSQSITKIDDSTQTDIVIEPHIKSTTHTYESILKFLQGVECVMSLQLLENINSKAFIGIKHLTLDYNAEWGDKIEEIVVHCDLYPDQATEKRISTGLTWNSTGSTIASSYGMEGHTSWCSHRGYLCIWNLSLRNFNQERPSLTLESNTCLSSVLFHPTNPSLIAAGNHKGEIQIWVLTDHHTIASIWSGHQGEVSALSWIKEDQNFNLISVGVDGLINEWNINSKSAIRK